MYVVREPNTRDLTRHELVIFDGITSLCEADDYETLVLILQLDVVRAMQDEGLITIRLGSPMLMRGAIE